ncbi:MAG: hypothetical protein WC852_06660 [Candidatus Nanoarchaeia archaeon]|jgi:hypothetical protein
MGILTKSLVTAAAVAALYGAYSIGRDSVECPKCKAVEETVCEDIDTDMFWESGRRAGYMEGLKAGRIEGEAIGERAGTESGFERGNSYGYNLGLNACNEERYTEGLNTCDDTKYQDGMIEGEQMGLQEGQLRFFGSGTRFSSQNGRHKFISHRYDDEDKLIVTRVIIDEQKCLSKDLAIYSQDQSIFLEDLCINGEDADGLVDNITIWDPNAENEIFERERDFYAHQEIFLQADEKMKEGTEEFSHYSR